MKTYLLYTLHITVYIIDHQIISHVINTKRYHSQIAASSEYPLPHPRRFLCDSLPPPTDLFAGNNDAFQPPGLLPLSLCSVVSRRQIPEEPLLTTNAPYGAYQR